MKNKSYYNYKLIVFLSLIIIIGLSIRLYHIGKTDIWKDEAYNIYIAQKESAIDVLKTAVVSSVSHPPLGYIFLHMWGRLAGFSEAGARSLSATLGALSLLLIFLIGREIANERVGLIAALIAAVSRIHIIFSQDAKHYMLFAALALLSSLFWIKFIKKNKTRDLALNIFFTVLCFYTHFFTIILIAIQNIFSIAFCKKIKNWIKGQIILTVFLIPSVILIYNAFRYEVREMAELMLNKGFPAIMANNIFIFIIAPILFISAAIFISLFLKKKASYLKISKKPKKTQTALVIFTILLSLFYLLLEFIITEPRGIIKYIFFLMPVIFLVIAYLIEIIYNKKIKFAVVFLIVAISLFAVINLFSVQTKDSMSEIAGFIEKNQQPDELIIYSGDLTGLSFKYYYKGNSELIDGYTGNAFADNFTEKADSAESEKNIREKIKGRKGVWAIYQSDYSQKLENIMENNLKDIIKKVSEKNYLQTKVAYFEVIGQ